MVGHPNHLESNGTYVGQGGRFVNRFYVFLIRAGLGAFFAVLLSRFFYPNANPAYMAGLGIFLVGMAYVMESMRKSKINETNTLQKK